MSAEPATVGQRCVVCIPTSSGGHLTVSGILSQPAAKSLCSRVQALDPHEVATTSSGPRCQFVHMSEELRNLYVNDRPPHVSGGKEFKTAMLQTNQAYVWDLDLQEPCK